MRDWDDIDEQATREGHAMKFANKSKRPRKPGGLTKEYIGKKKKRDILAELNFITERDGNAY